VRVLVVGVGNVFLGDDGFGVEIARCLAAEELPPGVEAKDYGVRALHLAYALLEPRDLVIVVDAVRRGDPPGTLTLLEPALEGGAAAAAPDAHGMDLGSVFSAVRALGGTLPRVLIVGCEVAGIGEGIGFSPAVEAAVGPAVELVREVVERELARGEERRCGATSG